MMGELDQAGRRGPGSRAIDAMLPHDHLLRRIDRLLDLTELRGALASHYSRRGRPSIAPELLIRMALIGRIYAITSARLCAITRHSRQAPSGDPGVGGRLSAGAAPPGTLIKSRPPIVVVARLPKHH